MSEAETTAVPTSLGRPRYTSAARTRGRTRRRPLFQGGRALSRRSGVASGGVSGWPGASVCGLRRLPGARGCAVRRQRPCEWSLRSSADLSPCGCGLRRRPDARLTDRLADLVARCSRSRGECGRTTGGGLHSYGSRYGHPGERSGHRVTADGTPGLCLCWFHPRRVGTALCDFDAWRRCEPPSPIATVGATHGACRRWRVPSSSARARSPSASVAGGVLPRYGPPWLGGSFSKPGGTFPDPHEYSPASGPKSGAVTTSTPIRELRTHPTPSPARCTPLRDTERLCRTSAGSSCPAVGSADRGPG